MEKFKRFSLKMLCCEAIDFLLVRLHDKLAIFYAAENTHAYESGHVASGDFVLGRGVLCEFADYWPLAVSMPPTKLCLQCKAAIPVRLKTCECCDHGRV